MSATLAHPPGPRGRPPLDDLRALQRGPHEFLLKIAHDYGPVVRYPIGPLAVYLVSHPDGVRHVLQENHRNYSKDTFQYRLLSTITGTGLLTSDGDHWLRQRRLAQGAFHRSQIAAFADLMSAASTAMLTRWDAAADRGTPLDIAAEMMHLALQIVGRALFSVEIGDQADTLAQATLIVLDHIVGRARTFGVIPTWLPTTGNRRFAAAMRTLEEAVYATVHKRRATTSAEAASTPHDLLAMLMAARDPATGEAMSDRQLRDEVMTMLIAGHETVASALAWTWHLLAGHPEVEARLHRELDEELGGRPPTAADLPRLRYTEMVFLEAMRLYPPAWIITRRALADDQIGDYRIPAGALVVTSPYVTHRLPAWWNAAEQFIPERFAAEPSAARPRFAYYPFGGGPRQCIGNNFALVEAVVVIATVAQRYRLHALHGHPIEVEPGVTLRPKHGLLMQLERRGN